MPRPRRCYIFTTEEQLTRDIADGIVTTEDAIAMHEFRQFLATTDPEITMPTETHGENYVDN
jgi:hypothetical protein